MADEQNNKQRPQEEGGLENGRPGEAPQSGQRDPSAPVSPAPGENYDPSRQGFGRPAGGGPPPDYRDPCRGHGPYDYDPGRFPPNGAGYPPPVEEDYRWNFEDYQAAGGHKGMPRRSKGLFAFGILMIAVVVFGAVIFSAYGAYSILSRVESAPPPSSRPSGSSQEGERSAPQLIIRDRPEGYEEPALSDGRLTTAEIARRVRPSVVGILQYGPTDTFEPSNEGSGVIIDPSGYIITNAHVVKGSVGINVILDNGENYTAELIGIDSKTDLAVIKIDAQNLTSAEFGNSDELEVGEKLVAIGNPGGMILAGSVTEGIVSAVNRPFRSSDSGYSATYIQTDAAINPGNSGGALVNEFGQVVGINSSKIVAEGYEGIGFAIPINTAKPVIDDLLEYGYVKGRTKIGITGQPITEVVSEIKGIPVGIYIWTVEPQSDLSGKGVTQGDIITEIDGKPIESFDDISDVLSTKRPGDVVTLTIFRPNTARGTAGKTFKVDVYLQEDLERWS
ncbi:MAG TPA: trypsin-like peptidase domain-containing protein [Candidatus Fimivivens faecavium]|nr:trypsin-like peptidase domain-containing protein [Candidatus Fimivivens faecavium]